MTELIAFESFMSPEAQDARAQNNRRALAEGFARYAMTLGLQTPAAHLKKDGQPVTLQQRGLDMFGEEFARALDALLIELIDMACDVGAVHTTTEIAQMLYRIEPDADMRGLESRRRLHETIKRCPRYKVAPPKRCSHTGVETDKVWKREA